jgi:uncharacterized protein
MTDNEPWILTVSGKKFHLLNPRADEICIEDIAWALSGENRFSNHCYPRYKVAQHSVIVSYHVSKWNALAGLLHDASEAYYRDIPAPMKQQPMMYAYRQLEKIFMEVLADKYKFSWPNKEVETIDKRLLMDEGKMFMSDRVLHSQPREPLGLGYFPAWDEYRCEAEFLQRFTELTK